MTFLTTPSAIAATLAVTAESDKILPSLVLSTSHSASMTLQDFVSDGKSYSGEIFRALNDTWPSATSKGIRRALTGCDRYYLDEGDMRRYKTAEICRFLGRANKLMTDTLFTVTR